MLCWSCGKDVDLERVSFRSICDHCNAYLHCCVNCCYYQVGLANDCKIPGTERVVDREKNNFCEEFSCSNGLRKPKDSSSSKKFDDLFS